MDNLYEGESTFRLPSHDLFLMSFALADQKVSDKYTN